jgi:hypothetical protein
MTRLNPSTKSKNPGLVSKFLQQYQVLNLTEGHHPLDLFLWESTLEDSKVSGVLSSLVVCIHEELQSDPLRLVRVGPVHLIHILHLENKRNGGGFLRTDGIKAAEDLENLLMAIV